MNPLYYTAGLVGAIVTGLVVWAWRRQPGSNTLDQIREIVYENNQKLKNMPTKAEFEAAFGVVTEALNNIGEDITRLTEQLADGSLSEAEEADVLAQLTALGDRAKEIAGRTPEAQEPEEPTDPVEPTEPEA